MSSLHGKTIVISGGSRGIGGIDIVNNASAIDLTPTESVSTKRYDPMQDINAKPSRAASGNFHIDDEVPAAEGVTDFSKYRVGGHEEDPQLGFRVEARFPAETPADAVDERS